MAAKKIIVVGAGIIGASIAWHLTKAGAKVTLLSEGEPGGVATPNTFAWINASWGNPRAYFQLRTRSMREWSRLAKDLPGLPLAWTGGLLWDMPKAGLEAYCAEHMAWGYDIRMVGPDEMRRIEPNLAGVPALAVHAAGEGAVEPVPAVRALIADAERLGAAVCTGVHVIGLTKAGGGIAGVETSVGSLAADEVVVAAGAATPAIAAMAGVEIPLETPPGLIVHSKPHDRLLNGLVMADRLHMRQTQEGRLIAGSDFGGSDPGSDPHAAARDLFATLQASLRGGDRLEFDFHTVGYRPTPTDGFPIVGRAEDMAGLYLAVMHSGMTLAPAVGLFASGELLKGEEEPLLAPYRLARFRR